MRISNPDRTILAKTNPCIEITFQSYSETLWYSYFESLRSIRLNKDKLIQYFRENREARVQKYNLIQEMDYPLIDVVYPVISC